jgi:hypothetical protein
METNNRTFLFENTKTGEVKSIKAISQKDAWNKLEETLPDKGTIGNWMAKVAQG